METGGRHQCDPTIPNYLTDVELLVSGVYILCYLFIYILILNINFRLDYEILEDTPRIKLTVPSGKLWTSC